MNVKIRGNSPTLLHKYSPEEDGGGKTKAEKSEAYKVEWKKGVYLTDDGFVCWPSTNMMQVLFDGCKGLNRGKVYFTRLIFTTVRVSPIKIPFIIDGKNITIKDIEKNGWIDISGVKIGTSRVNRSRVMLLPGWELEFTINKMNEDLSDAEVKKIVENAGRAGMGDWRPSAPKKPGPYGTFDLVSFG